MSDTLCARENLDPQTGAINIPIYHSSTFGFGSCEEAAAAFRGENKNWVYSRLGNPTVRAFEEKMVEIEGGHDACAFASGMAAIFTTILAVCKPGERILCIDEVYGGTHELLKNLVVPLGFEVVYFSPDLKNLPEDKKDETRLIFVETPTNPSLHEVNLNKLMDISAFMYKDVYLCVDNTFATPVYQCPLMQAGADLVLHSTTKYIGGHGDLIGGIVTCDPISNHLMERIKHIRTMTGGVMSPETAFLCLRGLKTLGLRMQRHTENAQTLSRLLREFPSIVKDIKYPGFGGMLSVEFRTKELAESFIKNLYGPTLAVSLGETKTLVNVPSIMTHSTYTDEELEKIGLSPGLVRISVGLEDINDLKDEFISALLNTC